MHPTFTRAVACAAAVVILATPGTAVAVTPDDAADRQQSVPEFRAASEGSGGASARPVPAGVRPEDKITPAAQRKFAARETADFWLRFGDTADLSAAYEITDWAERGRYVVDTLRATAEKSQAATIAELESAGVEYETQWATNAILVEDGSLDLAIELAGDVEVMEVRPTTRYAAPEPVAVGDDAAVAVEDGGAGTLASATPTTGITSINADDLWADGVTGEGIVVAGIDTGVSRTDDSLKVSYRGAATGHNYNWFDAAGLGKTYPVDDHGHGTHTMGTMVGGTAVPNDGVPRAFGVAPDAQWIAANGCSGYCLDSSLVRSGQWILAPTKVDGTAPDVTQRPHIVNNSWGSSYISNDPFMEDIVTAWEAAGIFAVFSNGNDGEVGCESSGSPGSRSASYSVGAITSGGRVAPFSSRGPGQDGDVKPDVVAPGVGVLSVVRDGTMEAWDGTSMAAPHVAGAVALLWSAVPALVGDVQRTRALLDDGARDSTAGEVLDCGGTWDDNNVYGEGRLDVAASYRLAQNLEFEATQAPTVTGTAQVGSTLTAVADGAVWTPAATLTYQWYRDDQMISGATELTYTLRPDDAGSSITVAVVGRAAGYLPTEVDSAPTAPVANTTMSGGGWISGSLRVGATLLAKAGTAWPSGTRFTYQWLADGAPISGATGFAYVPTSSERGKDLSVTITATRKGYDAVTKTLAGGTVGSGTFATEKPYIVGTAAPGVTVYARVPSWTPSASGLRYQWRVNGTSISGATGSSYRIASAHVGKALTVRVTGTRSGFTTAWATSGALSVGRAFSSAPTPTISGGRYVGRNLTASVGTWSPSVSSLSYQWYANGRAIPGATGRTIALKGPQYGKRISVSVTGKRSGYAWTTRASESTSPIGLPAVAIEEADNGWLVGYGRVQPGTYIANGGASEPCSWQRFTSDTLLASDFGFRQRILTLKSTDYGVWSSGCGDWRPYFPGMAERKRTTANHGVYIVDDHLERGTYVTAGPDVPHTDCGYAVLTNTTGDLTRTQIIERGVADRPTTVTIPDHARAFETFGCSWTRVS